MAELLLELGPDPVEQLLFRQAFLCHHGRGPEERAHERGPLHPVAQLGVAGLFRGDLEPVQQHDLVLLLDDLPPRRGRQ